MPPVPNARPKLRLFRHVSKQMLRNKRGVKRPGRGYVYLENDRQGARLRLENKHGRLNGAFELPDGRILEIRKKFDLYLAFANGKLIGYLSEALGHREITDTSLRRMGIASALYDVAEPATGTGKPIRGGTPVRISTGNASTALFLKKRGYRGRGPSDREYLAYLNRRQSTKQPIEEKLHDSIEVQKTIATMRQSDSNRFHRIRVIGPKGTPKWLVIPIKPTGKK